MSFELKIFEDARLRADYLEWLTEQQWLDNQIHFGQLWDYYQNPFRVSCAGSGDEDTGNGRIQAQETGLPPRITGRVYASTDEAGFGRKLPDIRRKEVVIENDIAWRIGATNRESSGVLDGSMPPCSTSFTSGAWRATCASNLAEIDSIVCASTSRISHLTKASCGNTVFEPGPP